MLKLLAIYTILFYVGIITTRDPDYFSSDTTEGTIVGIGKKYVSGGKWHKGSLVPFPIINYIVNGKQYQCADEKSTYFLVGNIGDHVKIIYNPNSPAAAAMLYTFAYWTSISVFFLYVLFAVIVSIAYLYVRREGAFA